MPEESYNVSKTEDTLISYRDLEEVSKSREKSISSQINCMNSVRYDSAEQKIILSVFNNDFESNHSVKNRLHQSDSIFSRCTPETIRKGKFVFHFSLI